MTAASGRIAPIRCRSSPTGPFSRSDFMSTDSLTRRNVLNKALALTAATLVPAALSGAARAQGAGGGIATATVPAQRGPRPGTWLVLLGTRAGPGIDLTRGQTGSAIVVDGRPYLVDCGYGTLRQLVA